MNHALISFYNGTGVDGSGRTIVDVWNFSEQQLEGVHDYIQWLFPLREASRFNPGAPLLDDETIKAFKSAAYHTKALEYSLEVMLAFYGLKREDAGITVLETERHWVGLGDHNYLRLTRILKSLCLLGLKNEAVRLLRALEEIYSKNPSEIGTTTLSFWRQAID